MKQKCVNNANASTSCVEQVTVVDCADNSSVDSAKVFVLSSDKPGLSDSIKVDEVKTDVNKARSTQTEKSEPSVSVVKVQSKEMEPKRAGQG
ncbi:hypothetical protein Hanom_Chr07g00616441 [Helianthus anomalus]